MWTLAFLGIFGAVLVLAFVKFRGKKGVDLDEEMKIHEAHIQNGHQDPLEILPFDKV
jgi:hypothetical protein